MGKVSLAVHGEDFVDFVQKNKNTFHGQDGIMRLIRRDKRWYLEENQIPIAFSELGQDLANGTLTWKLKSDHSSEFVDTTIKMKILGQKTVRTFGKSMKQEAPKKKAQPTTEPRTRNLKRSLRELDANSPVNQLVKKRKGNNHDQYRFTAFTEKYHDDEYMMMRLQEDMYREAKKTESSRMKEATQFYPRADYLDEQNYNETDRLEALLDVIKICFHLKVQKHTFHLAIRLFDRYASTYELKDGHLKVLPWAAFSIAVKYIEVETVSMTAYSRWDVEEEHVIHLERQLFQAVDLRVDDLLPYHFAERFFLIIVSEVEKHRKSTAEKLHTLLWYILDLAILDYSMLKYASVPSLVAAACVCVACGITHELDWVNNQEKILKGLGCTNEEVQPIAKHLKGILKSGELAQDSGLLETYSSPEKHNIGIKLKKYFGEQGKREKKKKQKSQKKLVE